MRGLLLAALVGTMGFANGCNKGKITANGIDPSKLTGTRELREEQGGMTPVKIYRPGDGNRLKFTATHYEKYHHDTLLKSGTYALEKDTTVRQNVGLELPAGQFTQRIVYDNDYAASKIFVDLHDGKLRFLSGFFPVDTGTSETYEKIADRQQ